MSLCSTKMIKRANLFLLIIDNNINDGHYYLLENKIYFCISVILFSSRYVMNASNYNTFFYILCFSNKVYIWPNLDLSKKLDNVWSQASR